MKRPKPEAVAGSAAMLALVLALWPGGCGGNATNPSSPSSPTGSTASATPARLTTYRDPVHHFSFRSRVPLRVIVKGPAQPGEWHIVYYVPNATGKPANFEVWVDTAPHDVAVKWGAKGIVKREMAAEIGTMKNAGGVVMHNTGATDGPNGFQLASAIIMGMSQAGVSQYQIDYLAKGQRVYRLEFVCPASIAGELAQAAGAVMDSFRPD